MRTKLTILMAWVVMSGWAAVPTFHQVPWAYNPTNALDFSRTNTPRWWDGGTNFSDWQVGTNTGKLLPSWAAWQAEMDNWAMLGGYLASNPPTVVPTNWPGSAITSSVPVADFATRAAGATNDDLGQKISATYLSGPQWSFNGGGCALCSYSTTPIYVCLLGSLTTDANESNRSQPVGPVNQIVTNLYFYIQTAMPPTTNVTWTVMTNGVATACVVTIAGGTTNGDSGVTYAVLPAGGGFSLKGLKSTGASMSAMTRWTFRVRNTQ